MVSGTELRKIANSASKDKDPLQEFIMYVVYDTKILQKKARKGKFQKIFEFRKDGEKFTCNQDIDQKHLLAMKDYFLFCNACVEIRYRDIEIETGETLERNYYVTFSW